MKKILLFAAVATMFAACSKDTTEDVAGNNLPYEVLYTSLEDDDTRIQLYNGKTVWNYGDQVSVFNKSTGNECWKFNGYTGDTNGTLSKDSGSASTTKTNKVVALYPYDYNCKVSGNMISTTIPEIQTYETDSFGEGGNIMVAVSDDDNLKFNHIFGWIKLSLTDDLERQVHSIVLNGNNDEKLTGGIIIDASSQKVYMGGNNGNTIKLYFKNWHPKLSKETPTYFYIAVAPQTFAKGVSIDVLTTSGTSFERHYEDPFTVTRNHIQPVKAANFQSVGDMILYTTTDNKPVTMQSTDGFGAAFISNTYENGQGIIQFDGDITTFPEKAFYNSSTLESIAIPNSVTEIGASAFSNCSKLERVCISDIARWCEIEFNGSSSNPLAFAHNLYLNDQSVTDLIIPDGTTSINDYAFYGCTSLTSVTIPDSVTSIGRSAFYSCSSLTSITIGNGVTSIGDSAFNCCTGECTINCNIPPQVYWFCDSKFTSITIGNSVTSIGNSAFYSCSSLTSITIGNGVTSIGESAFYNCSSLTNVTIGNSVTSIGWYAFNNCSSLKSITIPDSVTEIGESAFYNCSRLESVYSKPITPPTLNRSYGSNGAFDNILSSAKIYVPRESVNAYKSEWSSYASKIVGYDFNE